jgi:hypothetical protein
LILQELAQNLVVDVFEDHHDLATFENIRRPAKQRVAESALSDANRALDNHNSARGSHIFQKIKTAPVKTLSRIILSTMEILNELTGTYFGDVRDQNPALNAQHRHRPRNVRYYPIDMAHMKEIYDFYTQQEPEINNANAMKTAYSQAGGARITFAGKELDPKEYPIVEPLLQLAAQAREYRDMFGFVAVFNPHIQMDEALRMSEEEERGKDIAVAGSIDSLTKNTWDVLNRVDPDRARVLYNKVTRSVSFGGANDGLARVVTLPRVTTLKAPSAVLELAAEAGAQDFTLPERPVRQKPKARTLKQTILDLADMRIISPSDGFFYVEHDQATLTNRVVFSRKQAVTGNLGSETLEIDETVYVFVWPGRMPERNGSLRTDFDEVYRLRRQLDAANRLLDQVNQDLANPKLVVEREVPKYLTDLDSMTDQQIYGGGSAGSNPTKQQLMVQSIAQSIYLRAAANEANERTQTELEKLIAKHGKLGSQRDEKGNSTLSDVGRRNFVDLPQFMRVGGQGQPPSSMIDIGFLRNTYRTALADALGMTVSMRDGGTTFSSRQSRSSNSGGVVASASQAGKAMADSRLHMMVIQDRKAMAMFIATLYDAAYRETDTQMFIEILAQEITVTRRQIETKLSELIDVEQELDRVTDLAKRDAVVQKAVNETEIITALNARLRNIENRVRSLIATSFRFEIHFSGLSHLGSGELHEMVATGALDHLDYVNALRVRSGLNPITDRELEANARKKRKLQELLAPEEEDEQPTERNSDD